MGIQKRNGTWWMDVTIRGKRYRQPLQTDSWQEAKLLEKRRIDQIQAEAKSEAKVFAGLPFAVCAACVVAERKPTVSWRTHDLHLERSRRLSQYFGNRPLKRIGKVQIAAYRRARLQGEGFPAPVRPQTVAGELAMLKLILDRGQLLASALADEVHRAA